MISEPVTDPSSPYFGGGMPPPGLIGAPYTKAQHDVFSARASEATGPLGFGSWSGSPDEDPFTRFLTRATYLSTAYGAGSAMFGEGAGAGSSLTAEGEGGNAGYYGAGGGGSTGPAGWGETSGAGAGAAGAGEVAGWSPWGGFGTGANVGTGSNALTLGNVGAGLSIASSGYGLYLADQARRERQKQLSRQREYQDKLNALMANPGSVTSLPGYQFRMDQGGEAVARRMASMGYGAGSGNLGTALTKYGQDYATGELERQEGLLAQLYGLSGPSVGVRDPYEMAGRSLASLGYGVGRLNG